jgi:hypothetical protein
MAPHMYSQHRSTTENAHLDSDRRSRSQEGMVRSGKMIRFENDAKGQKVAPVTKLSEFIMGCEVK